MNLARGANLLQQHAEDVLVIQHFVSVVNDHVKAEGFRTGAHHVQRLGMHVRRHEEAVGVFQLADALSHRHRFGCRGRFIQQRGGSDIHAGQVQRHLLEVQQRFQAALGHFRLIRGVSGVPARVFQHVTQDHRRQLHVGIAHANVRLIALVQASDGLQLRQRGEFRGGFPHLRRRSKLDVFWHNLADQCV